MLPFRLRPPAYSSPALKKKEKENTDSARKRRATVEEREMGWVPAIKDDWSLDGNEGCGDDKSMEVDDGEEDDESDEEEGVRGGNVAREKSSSSSSEEDDSDNDLVSS